MNTMKNKLRISKDEDKVIPMWKQPKTCYSITINPGEYRSPGEYSIIYRPDLLHIGIMVNNFYELDVMKTLIQQRLPEALKQIRNGHQPDDVIMIG